MKSSSESMSCKEGEPCSVIGVVGPCAGTVDAFRDLTDMWFKAPETPSSAFLFLEEGVVVTLWKQLCLKMRRQTALRQMTVGEEMSLVLVEGIQGRVVVSRQYRMNDCT